MVHLTTANEKQRLTFVSDVYIATTPLCTLRVVALVWFVWSCSNIDRNAFTCSQPHWHVALDKSVCPMTRFSSKCSFMCSTDALLFCKDKRVLLLSTSSLCPRKKLGHCRHRSGILPSPLIQFWKVMSVFRRNGVDVTVFFAYSLILQSRRAWRFPFKMRAICVTSSRTTWNVRKV